jgi:protease I
MIWYNRILATSVLMFVLGGAYAKPQETAAIDSIDAGSATGISSPHVALIRFLLQSVEDPEELRGYRIAILATDGVDGFDLDVPRRFLAERGAAVQIVVPRPRSVLRATGSGASIRPKTEITVLDPSGEQDTARFDRFLDEVHASDYDLIYLPGHRGGAGGLDDESGIGFLQEVARAGKSIFATGNSPLVLVKAGLLDYRLASQLSANPSSLPLPIATGTDARLANGGIIYATRDAFDMPVLMDTLCATLRRRPSVLTD